MDKIEEKLKQINSSVVLKRTQYCQIDMDQLFEQSNFNDLNRNQEEFGKSSILELGHLHADKKYQFLVYEFDNVSFDQPKLDNMLGVLLWEKPKDMQVVRCKGLINVADSDTKYSLQGYK